jgi:hypothetical protein
MSMLALVISETASNAEVDFSKLESYSEGEMSSLHLHHGHHHHHAKACWRLCPV